MIARAQAEQLRVLATADDVAGATGDRSTASWLATATRDAHGRVRADARLAAALDQRWTQTAAAFATGTLNLAQARVIAEALEALPKDLGEDLITKAETLMVTQADQLGPRELRIFGTRLLEYLAPDIAEEADYQRLLDQERRAAAATRATLRRRGDGSTDLHARIPDLTASLLRTFLAAFTAPRRRHQHDQGSAAPESTGSDEFARLPLARQQGIALVALLERILKSDLPRHGGRATSLVVLIDHDTLLADLTAAGIAQTTTGEKITAGQARRLACQASPPTGRDCWPTSRVGPRSIKGLGRGGRLRSQPAPATCGRRAAPAPRRCPRGRPTDPGPSPAQRTWCRDGRSPPSSTSGAPPTTPAGTSTTTPTAPHPSPDANRRRWCVTSPTVTQAAPRRRTSAHIGLRVLRGTHRYAAPQLTMRGRRRRKLSRRVAPRNWDHSFSGTPTARAGSPWALRVARHLFVCPPRPGTASGRAIRRRLPRRDGVSPR